ncbi:hypothetical protein AAG570_013617 [Ranatra chinensis]|uniref:DUF5523 domain-containing protein n=1 Tax=Ranatra chinensis TaxID=642074 RepID=A0ABD0YCQ1_9HEMI
MAGTTDWIPLSSYQPPEISDWKEIKLKQRGLLFCPSTSPVPIEEKLEPNKAPRFLRDEGLYVGKRPKISTASRNKMEQRIMATGSERLWFGEDGEIKMICDPLIHSVFRLPEDGPLDPLLEVIYKPAKLEGQMEDLEGGVPKEEHYILEVDVGEVRFSHHPLFSEEHVAAEKLNQLCQQLEKRYKSEIKDTRNLWLAEGREDRSLLTSILEVWRDIKLLRDRQGYIATPYRLQIISTPPEDDGEWQSQTESLMDEIEEEAIDLYNEKLIEYKQLMEIWKKKKKTKVQHIKNN